MHLIKRLAFLYDIVNLKVHKLGVGKWYVIHGQRQTVSGSVDKKLYYFVNVMNELCRSGGRFTMVVDFENDLFTKLVPVVEYHRATIQDGAKLLFACAFKTWLRHIVEN